MYERTQAQINLNALEANIAAIRQKIGPDTKLLGVIKADAYGKNQSSLHISAAGMKRTLIFTVWLVLKKQWNCAEQV